MSKVEIKVDYGGKVVECKMPLTVVSMTKTIHVVLRSRVKVTVQIDIQRLRRNDYNDTTIERKEKDISIYAILSAWPVGVLELQHYFEVMGRTSPHAMLPHVARKEFSQFSSFSRYYNDILLFLYKDNHYFI